MELMLCTSGLLACRHPAFAPHYVVFISKKAAFYLGPIRLRLSFTLAFTFWAQAIDGVHFVCDPFHLSLLDLPQFVFCRSVAIVSNRTIKPLKTVDLPQSQTAANVPYQISILNRIYTQHS